MISNQESLRFTHAIKDFLDIGVLPKTVEGRRLAHFLDSHYPESHWQRKVLKDGTVILQDKYTPSHHEFVQIADTTKPPYYQFPELAPARPTWSQWLGYKAFTQGWGSEGDTGFVFDRRNASFSQALTLSYGPKSQIQKNLNKPVLPTTLPGRGNFFPSAPKGWKLSDYAHVFTAGDTETGPGNKIVNFALHTIGVNKKTGQWELLDSLERYYIPDYTKHHGYEQESITGYTAAVAKEYRKLAGANYSTEYNAKEIEAVSNYLTKYGGHLVGQNIIDFDLDKFFPGNANWGRKQAVIDSGVIDTLDIARAFRPNAASLNTNERLFKVATGMSMQQAGLTAHTASPDAIATAVVYTHMLREAGGMGDLAEQLYQHKIGLGEIPKYDVPYIEYLDKPIFEKQLTRNNGGGPMASGTVDITDSLNMFTESMKQLSQEIGHNVGLLQTNAADFAAAANLRTRSDIMRTAMTLSRDQETALRMGDTNIRRGYINDLMKAGWGPKVATDIVDMAEAWASNRYDVREAKELEALEYKNTRRRRILNSYLRSGGINGVLFRNENETFQSRIANWDAMEEGAEKDNIYDDLTDDLKRFQKALDGDRQALLQHGTAVYTMLAVAHGSSYDFSKWSSTASSELSGIVKSTEGLLPSSMSNVLDRLTKSGQAQLNMWGAKAQFGKTIFDDIADTVGMVHPLAGMAVKGIGALTQFPGQYGQYKITMLGEEIQRRMYLLNGVVSMVTAPLQLLGAAARAAFGGLKTIVGLLSKGIGVSLQYGTPWTPLTGVGATQYASTRMQDYAWGLKTGTTNNTLNNWSLASAGLYTLGQVDTTRLVAAAMLGQFNNVYGQGGNAADQYSAFIDSAYQQMQSASSSRARQSVIWSATAVDSNAPQILSRMAAINKYLEKPLTYSQLTSPSTWGVYNRPLNDRELAGTYVMGFQAQAQKEQFNNSVMRLTMAAWNNGGNQLATLGNKIIDAMTAAITAGDWRGAFQALGDGIAPIVQKIKEAIGGLKDSELGTILSGWKDKFRDIVKNIGYILIDGFWDIIDAIQTSVGKLWNDLGYMELGYKNGKITLTDKRKEWQDIIDTTNLSSKYYPGDGNVSIFFEGGDKSIRKLYEPNGQEVKSTTLLDSLTGQGYRIIDWQGKEHYATADELRDIAKHLYQTPGWGNTEWEINQHNRLSYVEVMAAADRYDPGLMEKVGWEAQYEEFHPIDTGEEVRNNYKRIFSTGIDTLENIVATSAQRIGDTIHRAEITLKLDNGDILGVLNMNLSNDSVAWSNINSKYIESYAEDAAGGVQ